MSYVRYISNESDWNSCGFPTTSMFISQSSASSSVNSTAKQDSIAVTIFSGRMRKQMIYLILLIMDSS